MNSNVLIECLSTLQEVDDVIRQAVQPTLMPEGPVAKLSLELPEDVRKLAKCRGAALSYNFLSDAKQFIVGELGEISVVGKYQKQVIH